MQLIDRYLFRELLGPTLLATAALTGVALLSESLSALDVMVDQRQSVLVFLKIIFLAMPQLIAMIVPVAVLVGTLVALNRLHTEQEIIICFSGGMSRWRVISPALQLAAAASLVCLVLTLWIQPLSYRALRQTLAGIRTDLAASMIQPGKFSHPAPGVTVFAQAMDDDGTIHNLFIDRDGGNGRDNMVMAREGRLLNRGGKPMLNMSHGANQEFSKAGALNFLSFDQYVLELKPLMGPDRPVIYKLSDRYPHELFYPDLSGTWERANLHKMLAEGHSRIAAALYSLAFMAMAVTAVIGGSFSRMGYGVRIAVVACAALVVRVAGFSVQAAAGSGPIWNLMQYLVPLGAAAAALGLLFAGRIRRPSIAAGASA
ncbi:MAG TPA: LPS export ABC transporter permease LptF [Caulobacteraceae bacterium]|jgi:lipopolysaccharide export system permease protein|nr:LPS export ABC transporter permease LptF [Caulobacteraceae bacterium]